LHCCWCLCLRDLLDRTSINPSSSVVTTCNSSPCSSSSFLSELLSRELSHDCDDVISFEACCEDDTSFGSCYVCCSLRRHFCRCWHFCLRDLLDGIFSNPSSSTFSRCFPCFVAPYFEQKYFHAIPTVRYNLISTDIYLTWFKDNFISWKHLLQPP